MTGQPAAQDARLAKVFTDLETRPLFFLPEEIEKIRETKLYKNIAEEDPAEIILVTCSMVALNKSYQTTYRALHKRYKIKINRQVFNFVRLREPYISVIRRFKALLEERLQYIPLYSKQVRLKELQLALRDAKMIEDRPARARAIVEIVTAANRMIDGKNVNLKLSNDSSLTVYHKLSSTINEIHQKNQQARALLRHINDPNAVGELIPVETAREE